MEDIKEILCSASFYKQGYFLNDKFIKLPENVKKELRVICVCLAEKIKGIVIIGFYKDDASVYIEVMNQPEDYLYDEIAAKYEVGFVERENEELFSSLSLWYKTFFKGELRWK